MGELAAKANAAIKTSDHKHHLTFSACSPAGKMQAGFFGWKMITTAHPEIVDFLLACWNNRHAIKEWAEAQG